MATMSSNEILPATVRTITRRVFDQTSTRAKKKAFFLTYNNVNIIELNFDGDWVISTTRAVIDGLRAHGFSAEVLAVEKSRDGYAVTTAVIRRDRDVIVSG